MARQARRVRQCRQQVVQEPDVCFTKLLPQEQVEAALERHQVRYRERRYTPLVTIWTFLYQVLSPDQSCRAAVARLLAFLCVGKKEVGSAKTDPYCKARERLPEKLLADLARHSGAESIPPPEVEACNVNRSKRVVWEPLAAAVGQPPASGPAILPLGVFRPPSRGAPLVPRHASRSGGTLPGLFALSASQAPCL